MVIETRTKSNVLISGENQGQIKKPQITVFHCINALSNIELPESEYYEIKDLTLPCSSMTREVVLLRAFEAGADAVLVLVCPVGSCRYLQGNIRTAKRVERTKKLLDAIGLDGKRLNLFNIPSGDQEVVNHIIEHTLAGLAELGPNPAA